MNVLIVGGTGYVGTSLAAELVERGHDVAALSRTPEDAALPEGVEPVAGDVTAYDSMEAAFEGRDVAVNLVALSPLFQHRGRSHEEVHLRGTENVVRACEEHGVDRLIQMSFLGASPDADVEYFRIKYQAEELVRESDLDWVVFRPSVIFGEGGEFFQFPIDLKKMLAPLVPIYPLPGGGKTPFQPIWIGDMVEMLADAVEEDKHVGQTYEIGGPEVLSLADVTRMTFRKEGKSVRIVSMPMGLAQFGLTLLGPLPWPPFGRDQVKSLRMNNTVSDEDNDITAFGYEKGDLKTASEFLGLDQAA